MARLLLGTSGWMYSSWKGGFYPADLPSRAYLRFYARKFPSTEVNYSFYHLLQAGTAEKWVEQVPERFIFSLKASRLITHVKRLRHADETWRTFLQGALALGSHLGPILLQLPPSFRCHRKTLAAFLDRARSPALRCPPLRLVFEFRHASWLTDEIFSLLQEYNTALCIADSPRYPRKDLLTADFAYVRFHGRTTMFSSNYTDSELAEEALRIRRYLRNGTDVYAYFNNDQGGHAVENARTLRRLVARRTR